MALQVLPDSAATDAMALALSECHHRIKNDLQLLASWAAQATWDAGDPKAALRGMMGRIAVIGRLHDNLRTADGKVEFADELLSLGLDIAALADAEARRVEILVAADPGLLTAPTARTILLIVHELAVNALKHGFGPGGGGLYLRYTRNRAVHTVAVASECAGPAPEVSGTGSGRGQAIVDALVRQLGGSIVRCRTARGWRIEVVWPQAPLAVDDYQGRVLPPGRTMSDGGAPPHLAA